MSVSFDGFAATADGSLDQVTVDEELHAFFKEEARSVGTSLDGRRFAAGVALLRCNVAGAG